jgi:hypothetical protein
LIKRTIIGVGILVVIGSLLLVANGQIEKRASALRHEPSPNGWPADGAHTWSFDLPNRSANESLVALRIRTKHTTLAEKESPMIRWRTTPMPASEAEKEYGTAWTVVRKSSDVHTGRANVQLIDLSEIGAASVKPGENLRLLASVDVGGASTRLGGDRIFLPAGRFAGHSTQGDGQWTNNEMELMTFWIQNDRDLYEYDLLLSTKDPDRPIR